MSNNTLKQDGQGKRFNQGKTRYDLVPTFAQEQYARVLTKGADKYDDHNWMRGMKWMSVVASLERHLAAFKRGEDFDPETGLLHTAHIMCNAAFITEYYKIYPEGDDRINLTYRFKSYSIQAKLVDEHKEYLLSDFPMSWSKFEIGETPDKKTIIVVDNYHMFMKFNADGYCCYFLDKNKKSSELGYRHIGSWEELLN